MTILIIILVALLSLYIQHKVHKMIITRLNKEKTAMSDENKRLSSIILALKDDEFIRNTSKRR